MSDCGLTRISVIQRWKSSVWNPAWHISLYSHTHLNCSLKVCVRCSGYCHQLLLTTLWLCSWRLQSAGFSLNSPCYWAMLSFLSFLYNHLCSPVRKQLGELTLRSYIIHHHLINLTVMPVAGVFCCGPVISAMLFRNQHVFLFIYHNCNFI